MKNRPLKLSPRLWTNIWILGLNFSYFHKNIEVTKIRDLKMKPSITARYIHISKIFDDEKIE